MNLKEFLKYVKLNESIFSMVLGIFVIIFSAFFLMRYVSQQKSVASPSLDLGNISPVLTQAYPASQTELTHEPPKPTLNNPENTSSTSTEAKSHVVERGEDLWKIAEKYYQSGYNWVDIAKVNKLANANKIEAGQTLFIPNVNPKKLTIKEAKAVTETNPISGATYTVEKGDNLWTISVRAYGDGYKWREISRENNLLHPNIIHPGNVLTLPR